MDPNLTPRNIGAWLDKLFLIGAGAYFAYGFKYSVYRAVKSGEISAEEAEKKIKKFNFYGWGMISVGLVLLGLAFAQYGYKLSP